MWYVIQTMNGQERVLLEKIKATVNATTYNKCILIEAEGMRRREGKQHIFTEIMFPAYVFVDTYTPQLFYEELKNVSEFTKLLADTDKKDDDSFFPITIEDQMFFESIIDEDNVVRLSLVERNSDNRVCIVEGPLLQYEYDVVNFDYRHRRAIVELLFHEDWKKIRFGLCTKEDLSDNDMSDRFVQNKITKQENTKIDPYENIDKWDWKRRQEIDKQLHLEQQQQETVQDYINDIHIGSWVILNSGIYGEKEFLVTSINVGKNTVGIAIEMFGGNLEIEVGVDEVSISKVPK